MAFASRARDGEPSVYRPPSPLRRTILFQVGHRASLVTRGGEKTDNRIKNHAEADGNASLGLSCGATESPDETAEMTKGPKFGEWKAAHPESAENKLSDSLGGMTVTVSYLELLALAAANDDGLDEHKNP